MVILAGDSVVTHLSYIPDLQKMFSTNSTLSFMNVFVERTRTSLVPITSTLKMTGQTRSPHKGLNSETVNDLTNVLVAETDVIRIVLWI